MICPQYFYNNFTTNHRLQVVIGSNMSLPLKLLFYPLVTTYHLEFVVKML